jgi:hypothetical protein
LRYTSVPRAITLKAIVATLVLLVTTSACASSLWRSVPIAGDTFSGNIKLVWVVDPSDVKTLEYAQIEDEVRLNVVLERTEVYGLGTVLMIKLPVAAATSAFESIWITGIGDEPRLIPFYVSGAHALVTLPKGHFERSTIDLRGQITYRALH